MKTVYSGPIVVVYWRGVINYHYTTRAEDPDKSRVRVFFSARIIFFSSPDPDPTLDNNVCIKIDFSD